MEPSGNLQMRMKQSNTISYHGKLWGQWGLEQEFKQDQCNTRLKRKRKSEIQEQKRIKLSAKGSRCFLWPHRPLLFVALPPLLSLSNEVLSPCLLWLSWWQEHALSLLNICRGTNRNFWLYAAILQKISANINDVWRCVGGDDYNVWNEHFNYVCNGSTVWTHSVLILYTTHSLPKTCLV